MEKYYQEKIESNKTKKKTFFLFKIFCENQLPRHIKYKVINFAPINKLVMSNKLSSTNLERFLRRIKFTLTC